MKNLNTAIAFTEANAIVGRWTLEEALREIDGLRRRVGDLFEQINDTANLPECSELFRQASDDITVTAFNLSNLARSVKPVKTVM